MAQYIKAESKDIEVVTPSDGKRTFSLQELQSAVGGFIETIHLADGRIMVLNEEGRLLRLPINVTATRILGDVGSFVYGRHLKYFDVVAAFGGGLVGDVLICNNSEIE